MFEGWQITFAKSRTSPICVHFVGYKAEDDISRSFTGEYPHEVSSSLELLVDTLNDVRSSQAIPLFSLNAALK